MISLNKAFIDTFEPAMKAEGFHRRSKVFCRIVNGKIAQLLSYCKFSGPYYTIQFSIRPLCAGWEYSTFLDDYRMSEVFHVEEWEYVRNEYIQQMPEAVNLTRQYIFPLFNTIIDYPSYIEEFPKVCPMIIINDSVYSVNLILGNYEISKKSRETYISNSIQAFQNNWGTNYHIIPDTQRKFEQKCEEYYRIKEAIDKNDRSFIENYIRQREQNSLNSYVKAYYTPKKYQKYLETGVLPFDFIQI